MTGTATAKKMLYCPKCQKTYQESSQRFCDDDGGRLLPAPNSAKAPNKAGGVFTNLIGKVSQNQGRDEKLAAIPRFSPDEFTPANKGKSFNEEPELELELFSEPKISAVLKPLPKPVQPFGRIVKPSEIHSGTAEVGNRQTNPAGRTALTTKNPQVLIGQLVKGRYFVTEILGQDESGIEYLAEDKIAFPKKYVVRVLTESVSDDLTGKIYAEERIALSHVIHPNVVRVIDSGELLEGMHFIVTESVQADSVKTLLKKIGQFNALRTARIIRQAAYALSEVHQNGILHRNLKPENLLLSVSENGSEQVKLSGFGISDGKPNVGNFVYKAPEIIEGKLATFAGDIYSLAAVAYQMLTNRLPFAGTSEREILNSQRDGLLINPTNLRLDVSPAVDEVLEKAMAFNSTERYPKARDFGDAFFDAMEIAADEWKSDEAREPEKINLFPVQIETENSHITTVSDDFSETQDAPILKPDNFETGDFDAKIAPIISDMQINPKPEKERKFEILKEIGAKTNKSESEDLAWTRRSPEPPKTATASWMIFSVVGLVFLLAAAWGIWSFAVKRQNRLDDAAQTATAQTKQESSPVEVITPQNSVSQLPLDTEVPPLPRQVQQPPNTAYFQNSRQALKGDLIRNFIGFSLYYPNGWQINEAKESTKAGVRGKFLDLSKNNADGKLVEQMLVSYFESQGFFKDDAPKFPSLVKETGETLKKLIPNYQVLSEGETKINGWNAYEMKFQGGGATENGEKMILRGRRLFIPVVRSGAKSGYEITMLATSLANDVQSVDDVGTNDELAKILETFEPNQSF